MGSVVCVNVFLCVSLGPWKIIFSWQDVRGQRSTFNAGLSLGDNSDLTQTNLSASCFSHGCEIYLNCYHFGSDISMHESESQFYKNWQKSQRGHILCTVFAGQLHRKWYNSNCLSVSLSSCISVSSFSLAVTWFPLREPPEEYWQWLADETGKTLLYLLRSFIARGHVMHLTLSFTL